MLIPRNEGGKLMFKNIIAKKALSLALASVMLFSSAIPIVAAEHFLKGGERQVYHDVDTNDNFIAAIEAASINIENALRQMTFDSTEERMAALQKLITKYIEPITGMHDAFRINYSTDSANTSTNSTNGRLWVNVTRSWVNTDRNFVIPTRISYSRAVNGVAMGGYLNLWMGSRTSLFPESGYLHRGHFEGYIFPGIGGFTDIYSAVESVNSENRVDSYLGRAMPTNTFYLPKDYAARRQHLLNDPTLTPEEIEFFLSIPVTADEQIEEIRNCIVLTEEEKEFHISRLLAMQFEGDLIADIDGLPTEFFAFAEIAQEYMISPFSTSVAVRHFPQLRDFWCGPATAQQTLDFWDRTAANRFTQSQIATDMRVTSDGTDIPAIALFINSNTSRHRVVYSRLGNASQINSQLFWAMQYNAPPILRIQSVAGWPYQISGGHFLNASAISVSGVNTVSQVQLTDPWVGSQWHNPGANGRFWINFNTLVSAMTVCTFRNNFAL